MPKVSMRRVCVIGLGYVGLPTAASFAAHGVTVIGVDVDADRVSAIESGVAPTIERDLKELVRKVVAAGTLRTAENSKYCGCFHNCRADPARNRSYA